MYELLSSLNISKQEIKEKASHWLLIGQKKYYKLSGSNLEIWMKSFKNINILCPSISLKEFILRKQSEIWVTLHA